MKCVRSKRMTSGSARDGRETTLTVAAAHAAPRPATATQLPLWMDVEDERAGPAPTHEACACLFQRALPRLACLAHGVG